MNEVSYEITVRSEARFAAVWDEVSTLDRLLGHVPGIASVELGPTAPTGSFTFVLSRLGRMWKRLQTTAVVTGVTPPTRLQWRLDTPSLEWEFVGTFELSPAGTDDDAGVPGNDAFLRRRRRPAPRNPRRSPRGAP